MNSKQDPEGLADLLKTWNAVKPNILSAQVKALMGGTLELVRRDLRRQPLCPPIYRRRQAQRWN